MDLKNSETEKNLKKALQGEAEAYIKYMIYAGIVGEKSKSIQKQIEEIAHNEKEHWKVYRKLLLKDDYYDNDSNFMDAIMGENNECVKLYTRFAKIAREEGFDIIADKFEEISKIECNHERQFRSLLELLNEDELEKQVWRCSNCGYIHYDVSPPLVCKVCEHPINYFR